MILELLPHDIRVDKYKYGRLHLEVEFHISVKWVVWYDGLMMYYKMLASWYQLSTNINISVNNDVLAGN